MPLQSFYPVLLAEDVAASARFYTEHMGFREVFQSDWYVSPKHSENSAYELAVLQYTHETIPEGFRQRCSGLLLNFCLGRQGGVRAANESGSASRRAAQGRAVRAAALHRCCSRRRPGRRDRGDTSPP